jgi:peptide methionine sulfoxide reductase MsrB
VVLLFPLAACAQGQTVTCLSSGEQDEKRYCEADTRHGAHLVKQTSTVECVEGKTWGSDEQGIWVDKGCGGEFALGKAETVNESEHPPVKDKNAAKKEQRITCESKDGRRNYCDADLKWSTVQLVRQTGPSRCEENSTWGHDDQGIWVDRGCHGEFMVVKENGFGDVSCEKSIGKKESKVLVGRCLEVSPATHPPCNAANSCVLIKEEIRRSCELLGQGAPKYCQEHQ